MIHLRSRLARFLAICLVFAFPALTLAGADGRLDIYWIDVEGGAATLIVTPAGESILIDTGNPGRRDAERIVQVAGREAKLRRIDHLITTHYHGDHFGGAATLAQLMPIRHVHDNGEFTGQREKPDAAYQAFKAESRSVLSAGDEILLQAAEDPAAPKLRLRCLCARQSFVPLDEAAQAENAHCAGAPEKPIDTSDNANSIVMLLSLGKFDFFDAGDLTWNVEHGLVCPRNRVGQVDVYQVTHHGLDSSNNPVLIRALEPTVAVMNNGVTKGCEPYTFAALKETASIRAIYQVHKNERPDGDKNNSPDEFIANRTKECQGNFIRLSVAPDGNSYTIAIPALGHEQSFECKSTDYEAILKQELVSPALIQEETMAYTERAVAPLPRPTSAAAWEIEREQLRQEVLERVVFRGEASAWRDSAKGTDWLEEVPAGPGYKVKKLRFEAVPGLWIPALLYEPENLVEKAPAMLAVNGHGGLGKALPYKQIRCINLAKRGVVVLNLEWLGMGQLRSPGYSHYRLNQLDLCGTSGVGVFFLAMQRGLDVLESLPTVDRERMAVSGLSGGGWQTIFLSSLDPRVKLANPVAGYSSFRTRARFHSDLGDSEQTPVDLGMVADYDTLTAMMAPRATLLTYNEKDDCCFAAPHALPPLLQAAGPFFRLLGQEARLRSHINFEPGNHNFDRDNREALYRAVGAEFFTATKQFNANEIPCDGEVKSPEELAIELPASNATFSTLAKELATALPRQPELPTEAPAARRWQATNRARLRSVLRYRPLEASGEHKGTEEIGGLKVARWHLRLGGAWSVPVVEFAPSAPKQTVLLVADEGRVSLANRAQQLVATGNRVLVVEPWYVGEARPQSHDFLFALLLSSVGDRPLGLQAAQLNAVAAWARSIYPTVDVAIEAQGPKMSLAALCAAAVDPQPLSSLAVQRSLTSMKEVLERDWQVTDGPEYFCFGLLESFDVKHLAALTAPRAVSFIGADERSRRELAGLKPWYATLGTEHEPLP